MLPVTISRRIPGHGIWHTPRGAPHEPGPRAFYVALYPELGLVCDPDMPLEHKAWVVVLCEGDFVTEGIVETKHPQKTKFVRVGGIRFTRKNLGTNIDAEWSMHRVFAVRRPMDTS